MTGIRTVVFVAAAALIPACGGDGDAFPDDGGGVDAADEADGPTDGAADGEPEADGPGEDADGEDLDAGETADAEGDGPGDADAPGEAETCVPTGDEICDGIDNDCDHRIDEEDAVDAPLWHPDGDGDGFGGHVAVRACSAPPGHVAGDGDCDDTDPEVRPDAAERCNGVDDDCDYRIDEGDAVDRVTWYLDYDRDGYGDDAITELACAAPSSLYVAAGGDCDDLDPDYGPGAAGFCDDTDHDCDGAVDDDADGDGWSASSCGGSDCDDGDAAVFPEPAGPCAQGTSCRDILLLGRSRGDGVYGVDPDGYGAGDPPFDAWCDMTTNGGGYTLAASFVLGDGALSWTAQWGGVDALLNWRTTGGFGDLARFREADYKSPAYSRVAGTDLLVADDHGNWVAYAGGLVQPTVLGTIMSYIRCQTTFVPVTVASSDAVMSDYGALMYYASDGNDSDRCPFNYGDWTSAAVIGLAGTGCGSSGLGHVTRAAYGGSQDTSFCLVASPRLNDTEPCGPWYGRVTPSGFGGGCAYSLLLVR